MADLVALSSHEPLQDRIDSLRASRCRLTARAVCRDETCPPALRVEGLLILDGADPEDLVLALSSLIPTQTLDSREVGSKLAKDWFRGDVIEMIAAKVTAGTRDLERYWLLGLWGLCVFIQDQGESIKSKVSEVPLTLVDSLVAIATEAFVADSVGKSELMGSHRPEALAALCVRMLGVLSNPGWIRKALEGYQARPLRAAAVNCMVKEYCPRTKQDEELLCIALCDALEEAIRNDDKLKRWTELWYHGANPEKDESARRMDAYCRPFAKESLSLIVCIERCVKSLVVSNDFDAAVATRFVFVLGSWAAEDDGICLPWVAEECYQAAKNAIGHVIKVMGRDQIVIHVEELRQRLARDAWKTDWTGTAGLVNLAIYASQLCVLADADTHLLPALLPIADDIDPRVAGPAWVAIRTSLPLISPNEAPLLFRAIERGFTSQDVTQYEAVAECLRLALERFDQTTFREHDLFLERLARDLYYSANSNPALYIIAVQSVMVSIVSQSGLFAVRMLDPLLDAVQAGAQSRKCAEFAAQLLDSILTACEPRVHAHRGKIFVIFLRLSVNVTDKEMLGSVFRRFRSAVGAGNQKWIDDQITKLDQAAPELVEKFVETKLDLLD